METIKNYLEGMFANLPDTPEVKKAKDELYQMMEDKYNELCSDGVNDNEAVSKVISEFGNLDEIAQELGIDSALEENRAVNRKPITLEDAKEYLADSKKYAFRIALGVAFCILSVTSVIFVSGIEDAGGKFFGNLADALSVSSMFIFIAIGVLLFIFASASMKKWKFIEKLACSMDMETSDYVKEEESAFTPKYALMLSIGVALCILSVVPAAISDEIEDILTTSVEVGSLGGGFMFLFVAVGVFFIVYVSNIKGSFDDLFKAASRKVRAAGSKCVSSDENVSSGSGNVYTSSDEEDTGRTFVSPMAETVMDVFWPTVTCIYLIWSFLTFRWYITWIIWPIAAVINSVLESILTKRS